MIILFKYINNQVVNNVYFFYFQYLHCILKIRILKKPFNGYIKAPAGLSLEHW